ncbi:hypothetical protein GCM10027280_06940 [Micromonospora polyrhachis]|uniref:PPE family protein n=1 Tax=Micromonospora polyrhachis TaxID=1282883 RepID=A0A7W7SKD5_9ACTN|nr:hypothetical protein [Micromonospora polyrhachis]MBB4956393.1 hypothetical protein [Micromonospora polyrhachis]
MAIPYNMLPIEVHLAMITAEQANVPVLIDAARMWTEVREWIEAARTELHTRVGELAPTWTDDAGRAHEEKAQRTLAELKMWGDRLDVAQVPETLTTLASAIPEALQTVTGLHQAYTAALSNPLTAWAALGFQQAAGARMTALGTQFDMSMLKVVSGAGIQSPADLLPESTGGAPPAEGNSPADFIEAATAGVTVLSELQTLASSISSGVTGVTDLPGLNDSAGPSLAGLTPSPPVPDPFSGASLGGVPPTGGPPVAGGAGGAGTAGGTGLMPLAKPVAGRLAPTLAAEVKPGVAALGATKPAGGAVPPMMPPMAGQQVAGTLHPGPGEHPTARSRGGRRPSAGTDGVPVALRGRSGNDDPSTVTRTRGQHPRVTGFGSA